MFFATCDNNRFLSVPIQKSQVRQEDQGGPDLETPFLSQMAISLHSETNKMLGMPAVKKYTSRRNDISQ